MITQASKSLGRGNRIQNSLEHCSTWGTEEDLPRYLQNRPGCPMNRYVSEDLNTGFLPLSTGGAMYAREKEFHEALTSSWQRCAHNLRGAVSPGMRKVLPSPRGEPNGFGAEMSFGIYDYQLNEGEG